MNRDGHDNVTFFIGPEVEHTPAFSKRTLFVVGKPSASEILKQARANNVTHVFMGANHSFSIDGDTYWDATITELLDRGLWVTLDYQAHEHVEVLKMLNPGIWQSRIFVPLIGVRIPKIETSSPNLTVKIDDIDFKATNPGVWCLHFHEVTDSNRFTDWQDYESDAVIKSESQEKGAELLAKLETVVEPKPVSIVIEESISTTVVPEKQEVLNQSELGLDVVPTTALKPETAEEKSEEVKTPEDAAAAYAEGTTEDPLSAENSKKPKAKK